MSYSGSGEGTCAIRNGRQLVRRFVEETGRRGEGDITIPLPLFHAFHLPSRDQLYHQYPFIFTCFPSS